MKAAFDSKGGKLVNQATHVRSHQADSGHLPVGLTNEEEIAIIGNAAADKLATDALTMHPKFNNDKLKVAKKQYTMAYNVCHLAALALPNWKRLETTARLKLRPEVVEQRKQKRSNAMELVGRPPTLTPADGGHFWLQHGVHYRCAFCPTRTTAARKDKAATTKCPRDLGKLGIAIDQEAVHGHNLFWSIHQKSGMRVLACNHCDAYATMAPKNMLVQCQQRVRKPNWERLSSGKFPTTKFGNAKVMSLPVKACSGGRENRSSGAIDILAVTVPMSARWHQ